MTIRILLCILLLCTARASARWDVAYQAPEPEYQQWQAQLASSQRIETLLVKLEQNYQFPFNLKLELVNQEKISFQGQTLSLPYQLLTHGQGLFEQNQMLRHDDIREAVLDGFELQLYQLIAQLMIKQLKLPILGDQHAAANSLATLLLLEHHHQLQSALILVNAKLKNEALLKQQPSFSGSPKYAQQQQLFKQAVCLVLGSDPQGFATLPKLNSPEQSAERCQKHYQQQQQAMQYLLSAYQHNKT